MKPNGGRVSGDPGYRGKLKKKKKKVGDIREEVAPEKNTGQYIGFCFYIILFNP